MKGLSQELREELKKPFGKVVDEEDLVDSVGKNTLLVCIGDYCANVFLKNGKRPDIIVYDFKTKRDPVSEEIRNRIGGATVAVTISNPPGVITDELDKALRRSIDNKKGDIFVDGEEDLAGLVAIAYAPIGSVVVYGMPSKGAVVVRIDNKVKKKANEILGKMTD